MTSAAPPRVTDVPVLYFAYGVDMNPDRFAERLRQRGVATPATVAGYALVFDKPSERERFAGDPNIVASPSGSVPGVMFALERGALDALRSFNPGYEAVRVSLISGLAAFAFVAPPTRGQFDRKPTRATLDDMLAAPGLPDEHRQRLETTPTAIEEREFLSRLTDDARDALGRAEAVRVAMGVDVVHTEYLLLALLWQVDGPAHDFLVSTGITRGEFAQVVSEAALVRLPSIDQPLGPLPVQRVPPCSEHVLMALESAHFVDVDRPPGPIDGASLLRGALAFLDKSITVRRILGETAPSPVVTTATRSPGAPIPGFGADVAEGDDLLHITRDVNALCSILAARDVHPPVSVGLFGGWGSGKSFFMRMMRARIDALAAAAKLTSRETAFCTEIVQLEFNAWHYMDTDLWASLNSEIFAGLAESLVRPDQKLLGDTPLQYKRQSLVQQHAATAQTIADAEREESAATADLRESERRLAELSNQPPEARVSLAPDHIVLAAAAIAAQVPEVATEAEQIDKHVREGLSAAARHVGLPSDPTRAAETVAQLKELSANANYFRSVRLAFVNASGQRIAVAVLIASIVLAVTLALLLQREAVNAYLQIPLAALAAVAGFVAPFSLWGFRALATLNNYMRDARKRVEQQRVEQQVALTNERRAHQRRVDAAHKKVETAKKNAKGLEEQIEQLRVERQMSDFIKRRHESDDYTRRLGTVGKARSDFEQLSVLLALQKDAKFSPTEKVLPTIERIILYIDDLDRCPEDKCMEVLQAVHLLLALPLFVVVVGVDPRWLIRSLKKHAPALRDMTEDGAGVDDAERQRWQSTPMDYLEKIFQIPFVLNPMRAEGFGNLVDAMTSAPSSAAPQASPPPVADPGPVGEQDRPPHPSALQSETEVSASPTPPAPREPVPSPVAQISGAHAPSPTSIPPTIDIDPNPSFLTISDAEREYMKHLAAFVPSPRAAKRFINIYRLLRAMISDDQKRLDAFLDESHAEYRAPILLLAIQTGFPDEAPRILRALASGALQRSEWRDFVYQDLRDVIGGSPHAVELDLRLRELSLRDDTPLDLIACKDWAARVARYSFVAGQLVAGGSSIDEAADAPPDRGGRPDGVSAPAPASP